MIKNAARVMISPTIAQVIFARAAATLFLSPPDEIHCIPPRTRNISDKTIARIIMVEKALPMILESVVMPPSGTPAGAATDFPPGSVNAR